MNRQSRPIALYPYPPLSSPQSRVESASSEDSEFPPIRVRNSTPDIPALSPSSRSRPRRSPVVQKQPEHRSSPTEEPGPSRLRRRPPSTGLGNQNRANTIVASASVRHAKNISKPTLKRHAEVLDVADQRLSKKRRVTSPDDNDTDWLKRELSDVKERVKEISEHLRGDTDYRLEEILGYVRQLAES